MLNLSYVLAFFLLLTASFDLVGIVPLGGGNVRIGNLLLLLLAVLALIQVLYKCSFHWPPRFGWLLFWFLGNFWALQNVDWHFRALFYLVWLAVCLSAIWSFCNLFSCRGSLLLLCRFNYIAYALIAVLGLMQWALYLVGIDLFVAQQMGRFARINGFAYEPSYFATYLVAGWAIAFFLLTRRCTILSRSLDRWVFGVLTLSLLLCTSRMGYIGMFCVSFFIYGQILVKRWRRQQLHLRRGFWFWTVVVFSCVAFLGYIVGDQLLVGLGIGGGVAHSAEERTLGILENWELFMVDPWKGYGLGGIAVVLAQMKGWDITDYEYLRMAQGVNVTLEIFLASGLLGGISFLIFFWECTLSKLRALSSSRLGVLLQANALGLTTQFLVLQFSPTILRNYFWIQVAIVAALSAYVRKEAQLPSLQRAKKPEVHVARRPPVNGELARLVIQVDSRVAGREERT